MFAVIAASLPTVAVKTDGIKTAEMLIDAGLGAAYLRVGQAEAGLLVVLNGSPYEEGKGHVRTDLAARRARDVTRRG